MSGRSNVKYKLPNGEMFVRAMRVEGRTAMNQYRTLVRALNKPELTDMERGQA